MSYPLSLFGFPRFTPGGFAATPSPEVWPFGVGWLKNSLNRASPRPKEQKKESIFACGGAAAASKNNLSFWAAEVTGCFYGRAADKKPNLREGGAATGGGGGARPNRPLYSVIIPAYQAEETIGPCVRALNEQTVPRNYYEIIVVDDGSTDRTASVARQAGADRVLTIPHGGPSAARNAGVEVARGEIVLFTDADCEPWPDWMERMTAPFADPEVMGAKGVYRTRQRALLARLVQLEYEFRYARMARLPSIDFIDTYAAAYRRDLFLRYGGFATDIPIPSVEDIDFSFRLAQAGHRLVFVPDARVWHTHPSTLKAYLARKARYGFWRGLLYLWHPEKRRGDTHTDPALKKQFALIALLLLFLVTGLVWRPLLVGAAGALAAFLWTTLPFVRWAWAQDRAVALAWPGVTLLRGLFQGAGLAIGLVYHRWRWAVARSRVKEERVNIG